MLRDGHLRPDIRAAPAAALRASARNTAKPTTRTCISGYLNRRELVSSWGLTDAQAHEFFNKPMTLRLHIMVAARMVLDGNVAVSVRFVGD